MPVRELLLGCGSRMEKIVRPAGSDEWHDLTRLDLNLAHHPDVCADLETTHLPFADNTFDEVHAYEVLEHIGTQGDYRSFLAQFSDYWRVLRPNGYFCATVPRWDKEWAWGDPSHRRMITKGTLVFLSQASYAEQVGVTAMTDYRFCYKADFRTVLVKYDEESMYFALQAVKP